MTRIMTALFISGFLFIIPAHAVEAVIPAPSVAQNSLSCVNPSDTLNIDNIIGMTVINCSHNEVGSVAASIAIDLRSISCVNPAEGLNIDTVNGKTEINCLPL